MTRYHLEKEQTTIKISGQMLSYTKRERQMVRQADMMNCLVWNKLKRQEAVLNAGICKC